jgi:hypothetical protein
MKKNLVKSLCAKISRKNRRMKAKDVFSIRNSSSRENLVKSRWIKKTLRSLNLKTLKLSADEIRDYKKMSITKAHRAELNVDSVF